jgi:hypothetical protein
MSNILQLPCGGGTPPPPPPPPPPLCFLAHPDTSHDMTWIVDEPPASWVLPITYDFGDGDSSVSQDGEDAHEYATAGTYTITGTDAEGRTCRVSITVPHG